MSALAFAGNSSGRRPDHVPAGSDLQEWDSGSTAEETSSRMCSTMISVALAARSVRPTGRHPEHPCQVPARLLEGHSVTVECVGETDVVK